jgi:aspartyl aminopeptidase
MAGHRSMLVSADAAHALNPCYAGKYDKIDRPVLNAGPVVKLNAQQRYSTSASSSAYFRGCADAAGVGVQTFAGRNDIPCGSTIGPIISTRLGVQSVDVGNPILSMHSIREAAGISDHSMMISALGAHLGGVVPLPAQV